MPLAPGTRLGHYDVTALLGEGGMGQVWQATDTQLGRQVALKILPDAFAADPERLARFTREAQILASLNHPNIAAIHGIEEAEGTRALVLELVEGPTLADRISQGPIPLDDALPIAKQIAEALEAAHEAGVIHRDLKPANIKVREDGTVKVLDFGLAKALDPNPDADPSQSPTLTAAATQMGVIMGTAAYMSPEQASGETTNKRSDIWSFGVIVFEMLTGHRLFEGKTVSHVLGAVLQVEPHWEALPILTPQPVRKLLRRCLQKERKRRLRDIGDALTDLDDAQTEPTPSGTTPVPSQARAGWRQALPWVAGIVVGGVITGLAVWSAMRVPEASPRIVRFSVAPEQLRITVGTLDLAISPDGTQLAYITDVGTGSWALQVRPLHQLGSETLVEGSAVSGPFFSPDGGSVGFVDGSETPSVLKRVSVQGGPPSTICELPPGPVVGASWGADGTIVFGTGVGLGLWRVPAVGGEPAQLTTPNEAQGEVNHLFPEILPDGQHVLFSIGATQIEESQIAVLSLDTGVQKTVIRGGRFARYAHTGHLLYDVQGVVWAAPFDLARLETVGEPVPVQEDVLTKATGVADFALAESGTLVYMPGVGPTTTTLGWVNRAGVMTAPIVEGETQSWPRLSSDGRRVLFHQGASIAGDLWIWDLSRGSETKLTETGEVNTHPIWTPDGATVTFARGSAAFYQLHSRPADLSREAEVLRPTDHTSNPGSWTPDGDTLIYYATKPDGSDRDIWMLPRDGDPVVFLATAFNEVGPRLSPNGQWLAYVSDQTGEDRVFVQAFPNGGERFPISTGPGTEVVWSRDGAELFYRHGTELWAVDVETDSRFAAGRPRLLFQEPYDLEPYAGGPAGRYANYDVSIDGQQFLMVQRKETAETPLVVVLNWTEELKRLVPIP